MPSTSRLRTDLAPLVQTLVDARRLGRQILPMDAAWQQLSEEDAYRVMLDVADELQWAPLGWKIAGTNASMQRKLGTNGLVMGRSFRRHWVQAPARLDHDMLLDPIVESEFFFTMGRTLAPRREAYSSEEVASAVDAVHIGVEVAECRFVRTHLPAMAGLIADGFGNGHYVQGAGLANWRLMLAAPVPVSVTRAGELRTTGTSLDVMGHPLNAIVWLANTLSRLGLGLSEGELVSSGCCTGLVRARKGERIEARFGNCGSVVIDFF